MSKFIERSQKSNYNIYDVVSGAEEEAFEEASANSYKGSWQEVVEFSQNFNQYKQSFPEVFNQFDNIKIEYVFMIADFFGISEIQDLYQLGVSRSAYDDAKTYYSQKGYKDINQRTPSTFEEWAFLLKECVRIKLEIDILNAFSNHSTTPDDDEIPDKNSDQLTEIKTSGEIPI